MKQILSAFGHIILTEDVKDRSIPGREKVISATIRLTDNTIVVAREYTFFDTGRSKYSYHWMSNSNKLIHRWDNAHEVPLPTSPHHWNASPAACGQRGQCAAFRADDAGRRVDVYSRTS